jgi:hypothetical protein
MIDLTGEFFGRASDAFDVGDVDLEKRDFTVLAKFFFRVAGASGSHELTRYFETNAFVRAGDERDTFFFCHEEF